MTSTAADGGGVPHDGLPQIALVGRSNVGKSTLINALCRRKIARTSAAPGKTRLANIYRVGLEIAGTRSLYLVDLPGYGYARGGAEGADELAAVVDTYFRLRRSDPGPRISDPGAVLLLVDARHPGLDADRQAFEWLRRTGAEPHIVATKVDKLSRSERMRNFNELAKAFEMAALPVSALSGEGLDDLWRLISRLART